MSIHQTDHYLNSQVSIYRRSTDVEGNTATLKSIHQRIVRGSRNLAAQTRKCRDAYAAIDFSLDEKDPVRRQQARDYEKTKEVIPALVPRGVFKPHHRHGERPTPNHLERFPDCTGTGLEQATPCLVLDVDHAGEALQQTVTALTEHAATLMAFISPSGDGIKAILAVDDLEKVTDEYHIIAWESAVSAIKPLLPAGVEIDPSGKNIARLCFFAHDPDAYLAPDDKQIIPIKVTRQQQRQAQPSRQSSPVTPPADVHSEYLFIPSALQHLADHQTGHNDNEMISVGNCMKAMGHTFEEWDSWAAAAGCTCTNRQQRWESLTPRDTSYDAILGLASKKGWRRDPAIPRAANATNGNGAGPPPTTTAAPTAQPSGQPRRTNADDYRAGEWYAHKIMPYYIYDRRGGTEWWQYQKDTGLWRNLKKDDRSLVDRIHMRRYALADELEGIGHREEAVIFAHAPRWKEAQQVGSGFWAALRLRLEDLEPTGESHYLNLPNGTLDLRDSTLHEYSPNFRCRAITRGRFYPENAPEYLKIINEAFGNGKVFEPEVIDNYLELIALAMTGDAPTHRGFTLVIGKSGSGKGGAVNAAVYAMGEYGTGVSTAWLESKQSDIDAPTAIMIERQIRIVAVDEVGAANNINQSRMLTLTGDNQTSARKPHGETLSGAISAAIWTTAVDTPTGLDAWGGIERRMAVLPTIRALEDSEKRRKFHQQQELADAIITLAALKAPHIFADEYRPTAGDPDAKESTMAEMDPLTDFLNFLPESWHETTVNQLLEHAREELSAPRLSSTRLGKAIRNNRVWMPGKNTEGKRCIKLRKSLI